MSPSVGLQIKIRALFRVLSLDSATIATLLRRPALNTVQTRRYAESVDTRTLLNFDATSDEEQGSPYSYFRTMDGSSDESNVDGCGAPLDNANRASISRAPTPDKRILDPPPSLDDEPAQLSEAGPLAPPLLPAPAEGCYTSLTVPPQHYRRKRAQLVTEPDTSDELHTSAAPSDEPLRFPF
ncbi:hypothetical protein EWM64_g2800 [Hericium alpestre]|uniref:Uncharacterized protein n=1 Tax=Hericium alpestre TaxID=135208 RepID=A0A4Z0A2E3_9AGAM|nr:hypothetical protein EWM64_g2800 [Hericium alpestre]